MINLRFTQLITVEESRNGINKLTKRQTYLTAPLDFEGTNIETLTDAIIKRLNVSREDIIVKVLHSGHYEVTVTTWTKARTSYTNEWPTYKKRFEERGIMLHRHTFIAVTY